MMEGKTKKLGHAKYGMYKQGNLPGKVKVGQTKFAATPKPHPFGRGKPAVKPFGKK
jgi:hypothetical protein